MRGIASTWVNQTSLQILFFEVDSCFECAGCVLPLSLMQIKDPTFFFFLLTNAVALTTI